jgi:hypothetical protein
VPLGAEAFTPSNASSKASPHKPNRTKDSADCMSASSPFAPSLASLSCGPKKTVTTAPETMIAEPRTARAVTRSLSSGGESSMFHASMSDDTGVTKLCGASTNAAAIRIELS